VDALAPVLGALIGALAGLSGAWITGRRQAALEHEKWLRGISDAFAKDLRTTVKELTTELAKAVHSMCWLCWLAKYGPSRLTQERVRQYDEEMHIALPRIMGLHAVIAGMDGEVHFALAPLVNRAIALDAVIGEAGLSFEPGNPETANELANHHGSSLILEDELHRVVAKAIEGYAVTSHSQKRLEELQEPASRSPLA
jgi:hypothetical protein